MLQERFLENYIPSQWFAYFWNGRIRYAQLDGILILDESQTLVIVEIKYTHTANAYWQIENLYYPLLREFLGEGNPWRIATLEICKWYDPATAFPVAIKLLEHIEGALPSTFNVHILNR